MTKTLIDELKREIELLKTKGHKGPFQDGIIYAYETLLSRHAEPKEEGYIEEMAKTLEYLDACGGLGMDKHEMIRKALYRFQHHRKILLDNGGSVIPTPDKDTEPLAVLAARRRYDVKNMCLTKEGWYIAISGRTFEIFRAPTYAAAEAKARQYLEALPDVKGGE